MIKDQNGQQIHFKVARISLVRLPKQKTTAFKKNENCASLETNAEWTATLRPSWILLRSAPLMTQVHFRHDPYSILRKSKSS